MKNLTNKELYFQMSKRFLTQEEIEDILNFVPLQKGIPLLSAISIMNNTKRKLMQQLSKQFLYPEIIPKLKEKIKRYYFSSKVQPGESVGIIAAQSIGEKQTQSTLNSFHFTGASEKTTLMGVPRMLELINTTKKPHNPSCIAYFMSKNSTLDELRNMIGSSIVELKMKNIIVTHDIRHEPEKWYSAFSEIYEKDIPEETTHLSLFLDKKILFEYKLELEQIAQRIETECSDIFCVFSPDSLCQLDIFADTNEIDKNAKMFDVNSVEVYLEQIVLNSLESISVCGIPKIHGMYLSRDTPNTWKIETDGSNLQQLLSHPNVNTEKTISNDMWEVYSVLGIEAARTFLIEEFIRVIGSDINPCHIKFLVDKMTFNGTISSPTRYSMRKEDLTGPLSKSSFEETLDVFINASLKGEIETTDGVSASIICGKIGNYGTGKFGLHIDRNKLV